MIWLTFSLFIILFFSWHFILIQLRMTLPLSRCLSIFNCCLTILWLGASLAPGPLCKKKSPKLSLNSLFGQGSGLLGPDLSCSSQALPEKDGRPVPQSCRASTDPAGFVSLGSAPHLAPKGHVPRCSAASTFCSLPSTFRSLPSLTFCMCRRHQLWVPTEE